jgi:hypothetical protein
MYTHTHTHTHREPAGTFLEFLLATIAHEGFGARHKFLVCLPSTLECLLLEFSEMLRHKCTQAWRKFSLVSVPSDLPCQCSSDVSEFWPPSSQT